MKETQVVDVTNARMTTRLRIIVRVKRNLPGKQQYCTNSLLILGARVGLIYVIRENYWDMHFPLSYFH